ncbi:NtaA/DmoA family FMN-dependent monooxygenase [Roseomonas sp. 18066]|uniref:NtaA/DmoA family FMN-dependent monooxygenase n=1 Tax=Roseomonas sp. 18066 TaxID=2681412 RepID=UPI0013581ECD|nr:NtaA/DmoA family FMN-dependent monooxygenase [Roseomonas sp. 18066]
MSRRQDRMILVAFADPNALYQSNPERQRDPRRLGLANFIAHAKLAESAGFDAIFKPDFLGFDISKGSVRPRPGFEPLTLLSALSQHTSRLGLIITESTSFNEPYNVARYFTSLDNISDGRASWNVVTSYYGEGNFGDGTLLPLAERYRKAEEFMQVAYRLWDGWLPGSVSYGAQGPLFDAKQIRDTNFAGEFFKVKEPLDIPPGPQGRPVIVQAGASDEGLDFAARHAEIVFAAAPDHETGADFYAELKRRTVAAGRPAAQLKILPGLNIFVADSQAEAEDLYQAQFTDRALLAYRDKLVREAPLFRIDTLELDERIPAEAIPGEAALRQVERRRSRGLLLRKYLSRPDQTLRRFLSDVFEFGHLTLIGTPSHIAGEMAAWFEARAADGFVLKGGNSFPRVAQEILPILREKDVLRPPAAGLTFREALFDDAAA